MSSVRRYRDERLNHNPADRLEPSYCPHGVLNGLKAGQFRIPRPVCGVEHEFNIAAVIPTRQGWTVDEICVDYLLTAARDLGAHRARGRYSGSFHETEFERGRLIWPGPGGLAVNLYDDSCKFEMCFGEFTSARKMIAVEKALVPGLRAVIERAGSMLQEKYGEDPHLLVHLSGGDGDSTCGSVHLNIPWDDAVSHAAYVSQEAFPDLQEMLLRQLLMVVTVTATGMPVEAGMISDPRSPTFVLVTGNSTLAPSRPMQFQRLVARPNEGYEPGAGRNMGLMCNWGQSEVANLLTVVLNQLETLRLHLAVGGFYEPTRILSAGDNLLVLSRQLPLDMRRGAELHRRALDERHRFVAWLTREVGEEVVRELLPDVHEALVWDDRVLTAIEQDDRDTLERTTDFGKKLFLADRILSSRGGTWEENLTAIRNVCFALASPQELSPYYSYFVPKGLEERVVSDQEIQDAGPDPLTRSYFFAAVIRKFWKDPDSGLDHVSWDWDRLSRRWTAKRSGGWIPDLRCFEQTIELPSSMGHNQAAVDEVLNGIHSLDELFEVFGTSQDHRSRATGSTEVCDHGA
jgi:hypothetical protein